MVAKLSVDTEDLGYLASQLTAIADDLHSFPFRNATGMSGCGSAMVANAGEAANDHFELRALLIETELRDAAAIAQNIANILELKEQGLTMVGVPKAGPHGTTGGGGGW